MTCESSAGSNTASVRGSLTISACSLNIQSQNKLDHTIVMCSCAQTSIRIIKSNSFGHKATLCFACRDVIIKIAGLVPRLLFWNNILPDCLCYGENHLHLAQQFHGHSQNNGVGYSQVFTFLWIILKVMYLHGSVSIHASICIKPMFE